jgi:bifunctional UDP-N-acetylglucosamine pyrophosphorylase/glucosamine-1-phosphate N-acetyltransferase
MTSLSAVVMAAGEGKRMKSSLPKVLHPLAGRPLVYYPVRAALAAGADEVIVVVSPAHREPLAEYLRHAFGEAVKIAVQERPLGTADAARAGLAFVTSERVLVLCGDTPLLDADTLTLVVQALQAAPEARLVMMTCVLDDPDGYGRVLRDANGRVKCVREQRDLKSDQERAVHEVNAGVYAAESEALRRAIAEIRPDNAQGEYYLTDAVELISKATSVEAIAGDRQALLGVNDRAQLVHAEALLFQRIALSHARAGVTIRGDARIDESVRIEPDTYIEAGVCLRGQTTIGSGTRIDVGSIVTDSTIGAAVELRPYSIVTGSRVGDGARIGPFSHLRPESQIEEAAHIGNFVETKKTRVRRGAKANHLSYLGDADVGEGANIGAGTIFCNYDGYQKHQTVIGSRVFIGSDSQIVAPVRIGDGAYVATGTTVTIDVPADALAIGRVRQENKDGYAPKLRSRLAKAAGKE